VLELRAAFGDHPQTRRVATNASIDDWTTAIEVLKGWEVFSAGVASMYKRLARLRINAVHYLQPTLDKSSRDKALKAVLLPQQIIETSSPAQRAALHRPHRGPRLPQARCRERSVRATFPDPSVCAR
jgi:hypothetical protein